MKIVKALLLLIPLIALLLIGGIYLKDRESKLHKSGTNNKDTDQWSVLASKPADEVHISVESLGKTVAKVTGALVTAEHDIMIPVQYANDVFDCAAYMVKPEDSEEGSAKVFHMERGEHSAEFSLKDTAKALIRSREGTYVSTVAACSALNLRYTFDFDDNRLSITPTDANEKVLPDRYDLRDYDRAPDVKNQGSLGTCWAFAAMSSLESTLRPGEDLHFSVDHLTSNNSFHFALERGGADVMGMAYLLGWQGPVFEKDDPYNDGVSDTSLKPVKHVQEIKFIEEKDYDEIKHSLYKYGAVETCIKNTMPGTNIPSEEYNVSTCGYYYSGSLPPDHEIIIVGWDDNYPKENFNEIPEGDGAFICQNSWGSVFGDDGYFYVSYYDTNVGKNNLVYTSVQDTDNYDRIYQSDLCGWVSKIGAGEDHASAMNVYTADTDEEIKAVGFYATGKNTKYKVYFIHDFKDADSIDLSKMEPIGSGELDLEGYYTVPMEPATVRVGERFAVAIEVTVPGAVYPIAVENRGSEITLGVDISDGEGYVTGGTDKWTNTEKAHHCNVCLKAYAKGK